MRLGLAERARGALVVAQLGPADALEQRGGRVRAGRPGLRERVRRLAAVARVHPGEPALERGGRTSRGAEARQGLARRRVAGVERRRRAVRGRRGLLVTGGELLVPHGAVLPGGRRVARGVWGGGDRRARDPQRRGRG